MAIGTDIVLSKAIRGETILDRWISLDGPALTLSFAEGEWFYEDPNCQLNAGFDLDVVEEIDRLLDHWSRETTRIDGYTCLSGPGELLTV